LRDVRLAIRRGDRGADRHCALADELGDRDQLRRSDERQNPRQHFGGLHKMLCDVGLSVG
jgi:hypothetical protein